MFDISIGLVGRGQRLDSQDADFFQIVLQPFLSPPTNKKDLESTFFMLFIIYFRYVHSFANSVHIHNRSKYDCNMKSSFKLNS